MPRKVGELDEPSEEPLDEQPTALVASIATAATASERDRTDRDISDRRTDVF
jgi:hypothetical protein